MPIPVPELTSLPQSAAEAALQAAGLLRGSITQANSSTVPAASVIRADPAPGTLVNPGSAVNLEVSSGPAQVAVPPLIGLTQSAAEAALQAAGLMRSTLTQANSPTVPAGSVSRADPAPGTLVNPGSAVNLEVSSGPAQIAVPPLMGLTQSAAEGALQAAGLMRGTLTQASSLTVPAASISRADPAPGTLANPRSAVNLEVSSGPALPAARGWTQYVPMVLFTLLGGLVLIVITYGLVGKSGLFFKLADKDVARGLITFLIAIGTVGIAIILAISTIVLEEDAESDKRFDRGKQVLTILIGVLGTIVGFYYGSTTERQQPIAITTTALPPGTINTPYPLTKLEVAGGTPPLKWFVIPDLPGGLKLDSANGTISGTPTAAFSKAPFKFIVEDSATPSSSKTVDLPLEIK